MINIAAAQYIIQPSLDWKSFTSKQTSLAMQAKLHGAQLLLLPEYAGIEIANETAANDLTLFTQIQVMVPRYLEFFQQLAIDSQLYIQPGTILVQASLHRFYNRAYFFSPNGTYGYQDKLQLVASEASDQLLVTGSQQMLFNTPLGAIGIAVCYDCEFPEIIRNLTMQGAQLILVPSYTPSLHSFHRVFYSCRARAIENQCFVLMSSAIGKLTFGGSLKELQGQANLFTPIDEGFPDNGIISQGELNKEEIIVGICDYDKLKKVRANGQVHNFNDAQQMIETHYPLARTQF
jgi:predicted amidohydrolase